MNIIKNLLKTLPGVRWFLDMKKQLCMIRFQVTQQTRIQQQIYRQTLLSARLQEGKIFPAAYEHQTFSQNGEDGILREILRRLEIDTGRFIEIGSGDGLENNTRLLLETGWEGVWFDGSKECCAIASKANQKHLENKSLKIKQSLVTAENVNELILKMEVHPDTEVLSLDLDLNTYHIWEKIETINPLIAIIEYNGFMPADSKWIAEYNPHGYWNGDFNMGAALKPLDELGKKKGYKLIGCDLSGANAFFVLNDLADRHFPETPDAISLFEPAQPFLLNNPEHRRDL